LTQNQPKISRIHQHLHLSNTVIIITLPKITRCYSTRKITEKWFLEVANSSTRNEIGSRNVIFKSKPITNQISITPNPKQSIFFVEEAQREIMAERDCGGVMAKRSYNSKRFNFLFKGRIKNLIVT
jgi:hypothetical protein